MPDAMTVCHKLAALIEAEYPDELPEQPQGGYYLSDTLDETQLDRLRRVLVGDVTE